MTDANNNSNNSNQSGQRMYFSSTDHQNSGNKNIPMWYDDIVFINGQALWTANFTVPNDYLTGSYNGKLRNRMRIPTRKNIDSNIFIFD